MPAQPVTAMIGHAGREEGELAVLRKQLATMKQELINVASQNEEEQDRLVQVWFPGNVLHPANLPPKKSCVAGRHEAGADQAVDIFSTSELLNKTVHLSHDSDEVAQCMTGLNDFIQSPYSLVHTLTERLVKH